MTYCMSLSRAWICDMGKIHVSIKDKILIESLRKMGLKETVK